MCLELHVYQVVPIVRESYLLCATRQIAIIKENLTSYVQPDRLQS